MNVENITSYGLYALLGLLISLVSDVYSSGIKLKDFSFSKYFSDNGIRILLSVLCIIAGLIFTEEYFGVIINKEYAFMAGLANDKIVEVFIHRKNKQQ